MDKDDKLRTGYIARPIYYGWIVVATCFFVIAPCVPLIASFSIFQVPILDEFHWSRGSFAIALAIHLIVGGISSPFAGGLIDRFGPRRVMPVGALLMGVSLMLLSRSTSLWHFYLAFGVMAAAGASLLQIVPLTAIITNWFVRHRGTAIGIVSAGSGAGQLALLPLIQYLIKDIGWRYTYLVFGLAVLIIPITLIWLFLYKRPEDRGLTIENESGGSGGSEIENLKSATEHSDEQAEPVILDKKWAEVDWTVRKALRTFRFWALALIMMLFAAGSLLISVQLVAYLGDLGYSTIIVASVVSMQGMLNMFGDFAGGFLCDRVGREKAMTLSLITFVICIVLLNLAGTANSSLLVYAFTLFYGIGQGAVAPVIMISASDLFQGKHFGSILGVIVLGGYFGGAIGAWLSGSLFDLTGAYHVNFLVSGAVMLISIALIWKVRPGSIRGIQGKKWETQGAQAGQ